MTPQRHSPRTIETARRMYGNGDSWSPTQIARYLTGRGTPVAVSTVRVWVEGRRPRPERQNARMRPAVLERRHQWSQQKQAHLIGLGLELRAATPPVPYTAISVIFARYEGAEIGPDAVRAWLTANGAARDERKTADLAAMRAAGRIKPRGKTRVTA